MYYFDEFGALHYKKQGDKNDYVIMKRGEGFDLVIRTDCLLYKPTEILANEIFFDTPDLFSNRSQAVRYAKENVLI